jgi:hypothetical protein
LTPRPKASYPYATGAESEGDGASRHAHALSTTGALTAFVLLFLVIAWQLVRLPLGYSGAALAALALVTAGYLAFRLWLTSQSLSIDDTGFELRQGSAVHRVEFSQIQSLRFDRLSHDLLAGTSARTYRIARTLQGHRVIRNEIQRKCATGERQEATAAFRPRLLPRLAAAVALFIMAMCVSAVWLLNPSLGLVNACGLLLPTYVLCDRVILARYRISPEGISHKGIRGTRFFARGELESARISKGVLSSTLRLDFGSRYVEIHEYLLGQSLVEISESLEAQWGIQVQPALRGSGLYPGAAPELP